MKAELRQWPADEVTRWPIDAVKPYPRNPRTHSDEQVRLLAQSISQYGFTAPLLVDEDGTLIYGHGRHLAAQQLGLPEVPVAIARGWTDAEKSAYRIADNQLNQLSGWDMPMLKAELHDLSIDGSLELNSLGFPELQLAKLGFGLKPPADPEATPELPAEPISKRGDLWMLGEHRLMCGDSRYDIAALMGDDRAHLVFTDPPYGVDIQELDLQQASVRGRRKDLKGVANDDLKGDDLRALLQSAFLAVMQITRPGAAWYVCAPPGVDYRHPLNALAEMGIARHGIVWVKDRFVMGRADYHYRHENIIYGWTPGAHHKLATRDQDSVWEFPRPARSPEHPTMKPVALVQKAIENSSSIGDVVVDPFSGSGTTIIAAEIKKRRCLAIEIDPRYVDVAVARWEKFAGKKAQRKGPTPKHGAS